MEIETINYLSADLVINFTIEGKHYPATQYQPAEYPQTNITKVFAGDVDISGMLVSIQWEDIYQLLDNKLEL